MIASNQSSIRSRTRAIVLTTEGHTRGPITRLMSPGDLGELVKPFVFLDFFRMDRFEGPGMADHPHSGLATHTTLLAGRSAYHDSTGKTGVLSPGSVEWMQAGGGVWHGGSPRRGEDVRGYQLWVALPPELELAPARSEYLAPESIPAHGVARVVLGRYESLENPIAAPSPITYLHVRLADGEVWRYAPAASHDVAFVAVNAGKLHVANAVLQRQMAVFEEGNEEIVCRAEGATELMIGSAQKHPHPLVCGSYSVHTSEETLIKGEDGIRRIARELGPRGIRSLFADGRSAADATA